MTAAAPDVECVVVGAGAVGLACAFHLARAGREVLVIEAGDAIGQGVSSRNSEVIHAGLYYPPGSLKARLCVEGRAALYRFCAEYSVAHRRCGKIVVAGEGQAPRLDEIAARARANGVDDLRALNRADLGAMEPELAGEAGLLSPSTGILDGHGYMLALQGAIEAAGGAVALRSPLLRARTRGGAVEIETGGPDATKLTAARLILAGGLRASALAACVEGLAPASIPPTHFARGAYFSLARRAPFSRLVYPVPEPGGLGVHLTLDLGGQAKFGPDVEWLDESDPDRLDYAVDPARAARFYEAIRRYWPGLADGDLAPAYCGVRPKLARRDEPDRDFVLHGESEHGAPGVVALYGIESPGLTSSLALGALAARMAG